MLNRGMLINKEGAERDHKLATDATWTDTGGRPILMAVANCCRVGCISTGGVYKPDRTGMPQPLESRERVRELATLNGWALIPGERWICPECVEEWGPSKLTVIAFIQTRKHYNVRQMADIMRHDEETGRNPSTVGGYTR